MTQRKPDRLGQIVGELAVNFFGEFVFEFWPFTAFALIAGLVALALGINRHRKRSAG